MKGGITSGVVYPLAICELAKQYRFKNIGGTSAGAIAAAVAAAAELGRTKGGFEALRGLPEWLGTKDPATCRSNLLGLFQPQASTKAVFDVFIAALDGGSCVRKVLRMFAAALRSSPWAAMAGAAPGGILVFLAFKEGSGWLLGWALLAGLLLLFGGMLLGVAVSGVARAIRELPQNGYGLCSGMPGTGKGSQASLTPWLADYLDRLAGKATDGVPLTFGDLWWPDQPTGGQGRVTERTINLEMMTTSLSLGRPFRLPFRDDEDVRENGRFYFRPDEFRKLFPERVVRWMEDHPRATPDEESASETIKIPGCVPLPEPWNLPVVVAVRMSLSFPILLSAVPLHAVDHTRKRRQDRVLERCWFSDGGMCSNFPVHLFDAPLPRWPTFAINLRERHPDYPAGMWLPRSNRGGVEDWWTRFDDRGNIDRLLGFLGAMLNTMQNWTDNLQSHLPGYRDRIAQVSLNLDEGGLNLNMPSPRMHDLSERGRQAGAEFVRRFVAGAPDCELNWQNHRWIRFRATMTALEEMLQRFEHGYSQSQPPDPSYEALLSSWPAWQPPSYEPRSEAQGQFMVKSTRELVQAARCWATSGQDFSTGSPRPRPELRVRPRT